MTNGNGNGRPLTKKKKVQLALITTILCWATQTLLSQWGYGAEEKFVPAPPRAGVAAGATLELRAEATVYGADVKLKQVCRWSERDAAAFVAVADLTLVRFDARGSLRAVTLDEIKQTLREAGVNLAVVRFSGPTRCTVRRSDLPAPAEGQTGLEQWAQARQPGKFDAAIPAAARTGGKLAAAAPAPAAGVRTLRQVLVEDLSVRLGVPNESLQVSFKAEREQVLNASEAQFRFTVEPVRVRGLGEVAWDVTILNDRGAGDKFNVSGSARAWQSQVVIAKPLAAKQVIRAEDVTERRMLVDRLSDEPLLTVAQALRQQASRDLKPGTVLTARMVDSVPLAKPGQFITVSLERGGIRVKTVGRAMEGGSYGQTIRVKNEATGDVYQVVLTAPQEGNIGAPRESDPAAAKASVE